jgi:hypothetical protein
MKLWLEKNGLVVIGLITFLAYLPTLNIYFLSDDLSTSSG